MYEDIKLGIGQSSLNMPLSYHERYFDEVLAIPFQYQRQQSPRFNFELPRYEPDLPLSEASDLGDLGVYGLKRLWHKQILNKARKMDKQVFKHEWPEDLLLIELCRGDLQSWLNEAMRHYPPSFAQFEQWVATQHNLTPDRIERINQRLMNTQT